MKFPTTIGLLVGSLAIVGCSTFTTELSSTKVVNQTVNGLTYRLPAKQFSLTTTYQVTKCDVSGSQVNLEADVKAILSERLVGAEAYTISYSELDAWTKITNTELRLSEAGLLTGINANIADQTGAVVQNAVATAAGIARAVALPPAAVASAAGMAQLKIYQAYSMDAQSAKKAFSLPTQKGKELSDQELWDLQAKMRTDAKKEACGEVDALIKVHENAQAAYKGEQAKDKKRDLYKRQKSEAEAEIARLSELKDVYEALGQTAAKHGFVKRIQQQEEKQAEAASELKGLGESATDKATEALTKATVALTILTTQESQPEKSGDQLVVSVTDNEIPPALKKFFEANKPNLPKVTLKVDTLTGATEVGQPRGGLKGIAYRVPASAIARVQCECSNGTRMLIEQPTQLPQFGPIGQLDLKNGAFANNNLEVVFNAATGAPEKLVFHSKSRAEAVSASAREAANSYLQLQKDKRDDILAANKASIDQQAALLGLEKNRSDASLAGAQAAASKALLPVTTEKSIVAAQIDLLRDQQRLDAVRTGTASAAEVQLEALANQQKLLEQQLRILQVEQQLAEQRANVQTGTTP